MLTSARWINDYLDPAATPEEQAELATRAGFPLEGRETVTVSDGTDVRQDFEMTSNRGDCVSHVGLAREIAAVSGRRLVLPEAVPPSGAEPAAGIVRVTNREPARCPLYTARIIRGATVGPSPAWLADRLAARGDIPRNNVVDATNFVLFELGQPAHVFDLATLEGPEIIVRMAERDEPFRPLGEDAGDVRLATDDLVIADARRPVALAGVKGGALTAVTERSTDLLLEAATFDPASVRATSRRHGIGSDSSYRFERGVHPAQIEAAADRLAALILETAGGTLLDGVVADGAPIPDRRTVSMRPERARRLLGMPMSDDDMIAALDRLGFEPRRADDRLACQVPIFRLDIEREVDLVEEVARMFGLDRIPVQETMEIRIAPPQPTELARQAVAGELVGMGFVEAVTHSLVSDDAATPFLPAGARPLRVEDDRAKAEPALQPSVIPGLLRVRRHNRDGGVDRLRLFESAAAFWDTDDGHHEVARVGLVMDREDLDAGLRPMRGVIQRLAEVLCGHDAVVEVVPDTSTAWLAPGARAHIGGHALGVLGVLRDTVAKQFDLDEAPLVAELDLPALYDRFPPEAEAHALPMFPAVERDLSAVVDEAVTWTHLCGLVTDTAPVHLEATEFVTTYRGRGIPDDRKSVTLRLRFRAADRTLTNDEVDAEVARVVATLEKAAGATLRGAAGGEVP